MAEQVKKPLKITETVLRDAHQSLIATRMTTEQMLPIVDKMDKVGYHSVECWGGATFDASLRFLKEDPWERLRKLRDGFKNTKLQMLFRGQNILGYNHYADDVVEYFVQKSIANGIDIIRIFDCFNDLRNLETAVKAAKKEKGHAQIALSYTLGDAYTLDYWKETAKRIEDMGADSICIKDMAGLLLPYKATELVQALKDGSSLPIQMHTHYTSGVASMTYLKAVEAGADIIDTAMSPFSMGTSQPATEVMVETFKGTPYDTGLDQNLLAEIADYYGRENLDASVMINLLYAALKALGRKNLSKPLIRLTYELRIIAINGESPDFFVCQGCGKEKEHLVSFSKSTLGIYCADCADYAHMSVKLEDSTVHALQYITGTPLNRLFSFAVNKNVLMQLMEVITSVKESVIDKKMKSFEMLSIQEELNA